jgi:hypothetical protein
LPQKKTLASGICISYVLATMEQDIQIRRRVINAEELERIRHLIAAEGHHGRSHLSRQLCRLWDWRQANGAYREIACRELLRKLDARGLITLPPQRCPSRTPGYRNHTSLPATLATQPLAGTLENFPRLAVELVSRTAQEKFYNGLIGAHHYLGYGQGTGEQLKYLISTEARPLAAMGFAAAAWRVSCRDHLIGWDDHAREKNLPLLVNNHRFLILPWIHIPNLASFVLAKVLGRVREDWRHVYAHDIVLAETFVEKGRFLGTCYRAANWLRVGETVGRGRNDRASRFEAPVKEVYVYPLDQNFRAICQAL